MKHNYEHCLEDSLGAGGLPASVFESYLKSAGEGANALRERHGAGEQPHLALALETGDLAQVIETADRIRQGADDVVICGTGGSSLGGQALAQIAGWQAPITGGGLGKGPRLRFLDNLDPASAEALFRQLDLTRTHFLIVSKSGGTAETAVQFLLALEACKSAGLAPEKHFTAISDPAAAGRPNPLRAYFEANGLPLLDHVSAIGGRYAGLTNVGLIPAALAGLDIEAVRAGARAVAGDFLAGSEDGDCAPVAGAALNAAFAMEKGCAMTVLLAYADRLERFTKWFVQLWAESLGKQGRGSTPIAALGPVDQHSQLQLYLDGPEDKLFTLIQTGARGKGPVIDPAIAQEAGGPAYGGKSIGDLVDSMQRATFDTLAANHRPVRSLQIESLNGEAAGGLMMHFILETIVAAHIFGVDPFDQPAVEQGKVLARQYLADM